MMPPLATLVLLVQILPAAPPAPEPDPQPAGGALDVAIQAALVADVLPRRDVAELRPRVGLEIGGSPRSWLTVKLDVRVDALVANRNPASSSTASASPSRTTTDLSAEVRDAWIDLAKESVDVRFGVGRLAWGRLDEIAPTDVINPLDTSRFLFEGRSEARLPVSFVRARARYGERLSVESVLVPVFRGGTFDRLDEASSPFNLINDVVSSTPVGVEIDEAEVRRRWENVSGGARADVTIGRVDVGVAAFRGFDGIGPVSVNTSVDAVSGAPVVTLVREHPRFTMLGGDFETVRGSWAFRGEAAFFAEKSFTAAPAAGLLRGRAFDAGIGLDRRLGEFRVFMSGVLHREWTRHLATDPRTDLSLVGSVERSFSREHYFARLFAVVNPADRAAFLRGVLSWRPSDRVAVDASAGAFVGTSDDALGQFRTRDFLLLTLRTWLR